MTVWAPRPARGPRAARLLVALSVLLLGAPLGLPVAHTYSLFRGSTMTSGSKFTARPDLRAPDGSVAAGQTAVSGHLTPGSQFNVYANLTDAGNPASGVGSVAADVSGVTSPSQSNVVLGATSTTYGGASYNRATAAITSATSLPNCFYPYAVTAKDVAGNSRALTGTITVDRLESQYHLKLTGASSGAMYLKSVASAGDVNGDKVDDVIIGREFDDYSTGGRTDNGAAYVLFGRSTMATIDLSGTAWETAKLGFRILGASSGDRAGAGVAGIGDMDADGYGDVAVGAPLSSFAGQANAGSVYVLWGRTSLSSTAIDLANLNGQNSAYGYRIGGPAGGTALGSSVAATASVLGDAAPDLLIGAHGYDRGSASDAGMAVVWAGERLKRQGTWDMYYANSSGYPPSYRILGESSNDALGWTIAGIGDLNGDGRPEALVGADAADGGGRSAVGAAYVVWGRTSTTDVDAATLSSASQGFKIYGAAGSTRTSNGLAAAGDVDNDGKPDILVGSPGADTANGTDTGSVSVVYGKATSGSVDLGNLGSGGYTIIGDNPSDELGWSVAGLDDINGDAVPDAVLGAPKADFGGLTNTGAAYVVFGQGTNPTTIDLAKLGTKGYVIRGGTASATLGYSVGAADVSGDGRKDVLAAAPWVALGSNSYLGPTASGESYVYVAPVNCTITW